MWCVVLIHAEVLALVRRQDEGPVDDVEDHKYQRYTDFTNQRDLQVSCVCVRERERDRESLCPIYQLYFVLYARAKKCLCMIIPDMGAGTGFLNR